ncbi:hypothetical protein SAY87_007295 [Trapa incisa]|uniref:Uncharacterized protein n=1 Tax=Trapa incisa TaxID=236973 RepID=A0AAN7JXN6_9MYRT|nr:hypothetical protein SAY87_007295 [Trapa incisa]
MPQCLNVKSTSRSEDVHPNSHPAQSQESSADGTPRSNGLRSPIDIDREYRNSLYTNSYNEVWTRIQIDRSDSHDQEVEIQHRESIEERLERILSRVLQPNQEHVQEALDRARPGKLISLVKDYLGESHRTMALFLRLQEGAYQAKTVYDPLMEFLSVLPSEAGSLTESHCHRAYHIFAQFDAHGDPFPCPPLNGFEQMRCKFSQLKLYLDNRIKRTHSRAHLVRQASSRPALCLIGTAVAAAVAAAAITAHSLLAVVVAAPCAANYLRTPSNFAKRELARAAKLRDAVKLTYALDKHLETIDPLVVKVQTRVERDKELIRMGIIRGGDPYHIQQVVKHLRSNPSDLLDDLKHLQEDICVCFTIVNKVRSLLLEQISSDHTVAS